MARLAWTIEKYHREGFDPFLVFSYTYRTKDEEAHRVVVDTSVFYHMQIPYEKMGAILDEELQAHLEAFPPWPE